MVGILSRTTHAVTTENIAMSKLTRGLTLAVALIVAAIAQAADPGKRWHGILSEDAPGFDPSGATNSSAAAVVELIFDRLLAYDHLARPAKLLPMLAEEMPAVADEAKRGPSSCARASGSRPTRRSRAHLAS